MAQQLNLFSKIVSLGLAIGLSLAGQSGSTEELKAIQKRGYLIVAVKDNLAPLAFKDPAGQLQGFEIELAQRLAQELLGQDSVVRLQAVSNQQRLPVVMDDQVDLTIARVTATASRTRLVSFSLPYYMDGTAFVVKDPKLQRLSDLSRQKIAVLNGSSTIATVQYFLPNADLIGVNSYAEGHSVLEAGKAIAFASDVSLLSGWVREYPQYRLLPSLLSAEPLCVVMPKGVQYDDLRRQVNTAIARLYAEGWLQKRAIYWGLPWANLEEKTQRPPSASVPFP